LTARIARHWQEGYGASYNPDRCRALECLQLIDSFEEALADWSALNKEDGIAVLTGARHNGGIDYPEAKQLAKQRPVLLVFGTGHGLAAELYKPERPCLAPVRAGRYNHLSVRTAAAVILDRLLGEQGLILPLP